MDQLRTTLERLGIGTPELLNVPIDGSDEGITAFEIEPDTWFDTWQSLRNVVDEIGHWPLATCTFGMTIEMSVNADRQGPDGLPAAPAAIIARVPDVDLDGLLATERQRRREAWVLEIDVLEHFVTEAALDGVDVSRLQRELGDSPDVLDVEQWFLQLERERGIQPNSYHIDSYLEWWTPESSFEPHMLLIPTTVPWHVGAYVGGWGWGYPHTDLRPALLRRWYEQCGAEPAANWGTTVQFVVRRPPTNLDDAWQIAHESHLVWPDTAGGANGIATRWHAHDLVGRDTWFVQSRP